jgi:hypothetical protein
LQVVSSLGETTFYIRLIGVIDSVAIGPIAFNAYEELKTKLAWPKGRRDLRRRPSSRHAGHLFLSPQGISGFARDPTRIGKH